MVPTRRDTHILQVDDIHDLVIKPTVVKKTYFYPTYLEDETKPTELRKQKTCESYFWDFSKSSDILYHVDAFQREVLDV